MCKAIGKRMRKSPAFFLANKDSQSSSARLLHFRPGIAILEEIVCWLLERENLSARPGCALIEKAAKRAKHV
jgi:hypothetical protein